MEEIRIHGRGGQGSVTAAELLAEAAFEDGLEAQAFPAFGVERRGAPVRAFARISDTKIRLRSQVYEPTYVIVQDATLLGTVDVEEGIKSDGKMIVNTSRDQSQLDIDTEAEIITLDATKLALDILGKPIMNTALLGAFSGATGEVSVEAMKKRVKKRFPGELGEKNAKVMEKANKIVGG
ncbi:MAG: Pyruvate:ferredoxin oxidoreductase gamma subunit PorG [Candidatus Methanohalarchaeum thermophilum]|uniref:pyruvate synthase n=1 Tax=Methanohalarchaeum thermophilum TaxID=1903181 RepID=A0A1Q6DTC6_METT1|nr:MAG: Pyruvate:ferredoxin oxidoreductase gamma subunit PorG [Candidatus Methanohalarchaeum thermophilum]